MNVTRSALPYGTTFFFEDLRQEAGGQCTIVGLFEAAIYADIPEGGSVILPKLGFYIRITDPTSKMFDSLKLQLFNTDQSPADTPVFQHTIEGKEIPRSDVEALPDNPDNKRNIINLKWVLSPFEIHCHGRIRMTGQWDDKSIHLGSIAVVPPPDRDTD